MKTTIEVNGYEIVISEMEGVLTVTAMKEGETVEEFELTTSEEGQMAGEEEIQDFEEFEGEEDMEDMEEMQDEEESQDEEDEDEDEEEEESEVKLESFQSFINKKRKK
jgi:hypothetical protein